ncbi:succinylglutamate desuccinylase [Methylomarinovum caldicuralii]|uniref:Succinylglutamate desuccinylase n=1 Tax=Methylomarinovum caldicuralii TaxID=438856 RepID=A0AAU9BRG7_9GAMM|nr:M14 family metallopeptidase [Methylomarinovum caldicuralii]BCX81101.1 succinylglutamate desuccinylase [Methylomarinovum caldicuralii]
MADLTLHQIDCVPEGLLDIEARDLHTLLPGPTLLHLPGRETRPLFVSVLLHGNEVTGLQAVQRLLRKYRAAPLPRSLSVFFGNVAAAAAGMRRLDGQPDYNRVWPGTDHPDCPEVRLMRQVWEIMRRRRVFASIDVHNNTGRNPHYACVNKLERPFLHLAALFGHLVVYFLRPRGVQSLAFAELCPAVTLECGRPGVERGAVHAADFIDTCLHLRQVPDKPIGRGAIDLFHTVAQVRIPDDIRFSFHDESADLVLRGDLDHLNFTKLPPGVAWGEVHTERMPVQVVDEEGREVTGRYFAVEDSRLIQCQRVMPSMLTLDARVIRQDCLCYLMERLDETDP